MNTPVNFEIAKLLKEKGFDVECENFYSKYGSFNYLKPHREYEHLHSYSDQLVSYFDGKYNWNSLDVDGGMIALKTAFSEYDEYVNCECSAPTISEVIMWFYEKCGVWISVSTGMEVQSDFRKVIKGTFSFSYHINQATEKGFIKNYNKSIILNDGYKSPTEAYSAAIEYTLRNLI